MIKTIKANIGGIEFTLNEDAFNSLQSYLDKLKKYFQQTEGSDDIMDDIEARIAEILQERLEKRSIVELRDVEAVQATIGLPEDFETPEAEEEEEPSGEKQGERSVYLGKRFFRNPDDKVLGGVCSGFGAYFNIDPLWIRLAFIVGTLLYGSTILIYIVLWIVIPEAKTTTEKLQMRGESVNVNNIKQSVQDEINNVGERVKDFADDTQKWARQTSESDPIKKFFQGLGDIIRVLAKALGKIFLAFIILIAITVLVAIVFSFATGTAVMTFSLPFLQEYIFTSSWQMWLVLIGCALVFLIPLAWVIIRLGFYSKMKKGARNITNVSAIVAWVIAFWMIIPVAVNLGFDFNQQGMVSTTRNLPVGADTLHVRVAETNGYYYDWSGYVDEDDGRIHLSTSNFDVMEDTLILNNIEIRRMATNDTFYSLKTRLVARGKTRKVAESRAAKINYQYSLTDNELVFDPYYTLGGAPFRAQKVKVYIYVPEDKAVTMNIR